jgi:hypothetical protein
MGLMAGYGRVSIVVLGVLAAGGLGLLGWATLRAADDTSATSGEKAVSSSSTESAVPAESAVSATRAVSAVSAAPAEPNAPGDYAVPQPPFSEGIYPCSGCHNADLPPNPRRRVLKMAHKDIHLQHDPDQRLWCLDCHNADNRDVLRSASGAPIKFEESYKLCGQCHGEKFRDWKEGVHGKRTGQWNGQKQYLLCVNCHNPHSPKYKPIKPMPPPVRPEQLKSFDQNAAPPQSAAAAAGEKK